MPELIEDLFRGEIVDGPDVARVLGTSARSVNRWVHAGSLPRPGAAAQQSAEQLQRLEASLRERDEKLAEAQKAGGIAALLLERRIQLALREAAHRRQYAGVRRQRRPSDRKKTRLSLCHGRDPAPYFAPCP